MIDHKILFKKKPPLSRAFFLVVITFVLALGCKKKEVFHIQEKFVNLYVELRLATISNQKNPKRAEKIRKIILTKYEVKPEEFTGYMNKIIDRPEIWVDFQTRVLERLKDMEKIQEC